MAIGRPPIIEQKTRIVRRRICRGTSLFMAYAIGQRENICKAYDLAIAVGLDDRYRRAACIYFDLSKIRVSPESIRKHVARRLDPTQKYAGKERSNCGKPPVHVSQLSTFGNF